MFELTTPTAALLKSVTPRQEHHGEDIVVALSMRLELTGPNTLLDLLSPRLRHALYEAAEGQEELPGVEPSTPLLRSKDFDHHSLKASFEGWTLKVDHGIDEDDPISLGGCKVDAFRLDAMEGGTIKLTFRVGTNDISSEEIGLLCGKLGSEVSITLHAPEKPAEAIDGSKAAFEADHPDATGLFAAAHSGPEEDEETEGGDVDISGSSDPWPFPGDKSADEQMRASAAKGFEPPPQSVTIERSQPGTRTARGRDKTKAALAAKAH